MTRPKHHLLYSARIWKSQEPTAKLRSTPQLVIPIAADAHKEIHREIAIVPVLDHFTAERVLKNFYPVRNDYIASANELMFSIDEAIRSPKAREIEVALGQLVIHAIELQLPIIKEGLTN